MITEARALLQELKRLENIRDHSVVQSKRQFERYVVRAEAELHPMDRTQTQHTPIPILLRDLSRGGIGFVTSVPLDVHSNWDVAFIQHGFVIGRQGLTIRHCKRVQDDAFLVGGQFCADSGLLALLGVRPGSLRDAPVIHEDLDPSDDDANFLSPEDIS